MEFCLGVEDVDDDMLLKLDRIWSDTLYEVVIWELKTFCSEDEWPYEIAYLLAGMSDQSPMVSKSIVIIVFITFY